VTDDELKGLFDAMREETAATIRKETGAIREEMGGIRADIGGIRADNVAIHAIVEAIQTDNSTIHSEIGAIRQDIGAIRQDNATIHADIGAIRADNASIHTDIGAIREEIAAAKVEMRRHFDVVTEATHSKIQFVAESVSMLNEKLDRTAAELHEEIGQAVSEARALIKWSYDRLDQRVSALEAK
jgi:chromosome segregation ATPase